MNDIELNYIMRRFQPIFRGVFRKNELDNIKITGYPFAVISNESDFGTRGTHWVALYFGVYGNCDFFDSYGRMSKPDIRKVIDKHTNFGCGYGGIACGKLRVNRKQLQSYNSDVCGHYCIFFLSKRITEKRPMEKILAIFNEDNKVENDRFVLDYVNNNFIK